MAYEPANTSLSQNESSRYYLQNDIIFDIMSFMSKTEKLLAKLNNGTITVQELRTLLGQLGWILARQKGSHEQWLKNGKVITLATHSKNLKPYQIKQVLKALEE
jgi:predicted RNA binding protein YcfA (HicA-like mRNA interferase family)